MEENGSEPLPGFGSQALSDICDLPELSDESCEVLDGDGGRSDPDPVLRPEQQQRDRREGSPSDSCDGSVLSGEFDQPIDQEKHPGFFLALARQQKAIPKSSPRRAKPRRAKPRVLPGTKQYYTLPRGSVQILEGWLEQHRDHPYPSTEERGELIVQTGLSPKQIQNWLSTTRYKRGIQKHRKARC